MMKGTSTSYKTAYRHDAPRRGKTTLVQLGRTDGRTVGDKNKKEECPPPLPTHSFASFRLFLLQEPLTL